MEGKLGNRISFALNIYNEAEYLVCAQMIRKKWEYSLKQHYRTFHMRKILIQNSGT